MSDPETLRDLAIRARQLEAHLLRSPEYILKGRRGLRRQAALLVFAIALLVVFEGFFVLLKGRHMPAWLLALIVLTSLLAIVNCGLLIRTKRCLHRLNEGWLSAEAKTRLYALRRQQADMQSHHPAPSEAR